MNMEELIKRYNELSQSIKALESEKDNIRANILIELKIADITRFEGETHIVLYSMQKRKVLDKVALMKVIDLEAFQTVNEFEVLKIIEKTG